MNTIKILVICGPTATGKTSLGIELAQHLNGEIISADSRQVYRGMTVGTGKEYSDIVKIWGYDLVEPSEEFSVAHFQKFAKEKIVDIVSRGKLPILVGGTGLYIRSLLENINTTSVPPNEKLRHELENKSADELFKKLSELDSQKALSLNDSDKKNPRRLLRAIEIALTPVIVEFNETPYDALVIGLQSNISVLEGRLKKSIEKRMKNGMLNEVSTLLSQGVSPNTKSMSATGYREITELLLKKVTEAEALKRWYLAERRYVKRQLTWFKKFSNVYWIDITESDFKERVEEIIKKWDNKTCLEK